jgi:GntR family transcriptional regulator
MAEPMYRRIAEDLRRQIESGELAPGSQMKSEAELQDAYGQDGREISRNTVRDAIKLLITRGLVETRPGQGTFVLRKVVPFVSKLDTDPQSSSVEGEVYKSEVERRGRLPEETVPRVEVQPAPDLVAAQLQLEAGAQVISRHQQRKIDGAPWSLQTTFYPMGFVTFGATQLLMAKNFEGGMVKELEASLGIKQVGWRDTIIARPPTGNEREFFDLSDKVQIAVFEFRRTGYDANGKPIRFTVTVYPADRNQFELEAGSVPLPLLAVHPPLNQPYCRNLRDRAKPVS